MSNLPINLSLLRKRRIFQSLKIKQRMFRSDKLER